MPLLPMRIMKAKVGDFYKKLLTKATEQPSTKEKPLVK